jgi:hypothetical protein
MSGALIHLDTRGTFVKNPEYTLFSAKPLSTEEYLAESFEIPFDASQVKFGDTATALIPPKSDVVRRITVSSVLPQLYTPLGPGYVYPSYSDRVDGSVFVETNTLAIQPGDFVGYFNTQFLNQWATNFVGYSNISVAYDSNQTKFVFTSPTYANIFFQNENSASFWGFDIRAPDFFNASGYPAYNFTNGTLTSPLTVIQSGWIRGFTPPPTTGFSYKESVACRLVKNASLTIGGQTIDRLTSERLIIEDDLGVSYENQAGLTILQGKNDTSTITVPRKYYTRLNFNMDTISMNALQNQEVRVNIEFEKFENLPSNLITSNGFLDGASYVTSNLQAITSDGTNNFNIQWAIGWKNYIIMGPLYPDASFRIYNEDTGTFYTWTPGGDHNGVYITTNGGTIYRSLDGYIIKADIDTILSVSTTPWTVSTYSFFSAFPGYGDANNKIGFITSDARYIYLLYPINYYIIGSTYTSLVSGSIDGTQTIWTMTYRFYNKTAPLSAGDQTALQTFWSTYASTTSTGNDIVFPTSTSISSMTQDGSDVIVVGTLTYAETVLSDPEFVPANRLHSNLMWLRYDSSADFDSASSYSYPVLPSGLPASVKDIFPGIYDTDQLTNTAYYFSPIFDGRYIYFATRDAYIVKLDTQNFLSPTAYSQIDCTILYPNPLNTTLFLSDGRYLYTGSSSARGLTGLFSRYDTTQPIDQQSSWEYYTGDTLIRASDFEFSSAGGFDGKYMYFYTNSVQQQVFFPETDFSRVATWHVYDTTKPFNDVNSWEWISFLPNNVTNASDGSHPNIKLFTHRTDVANTDPAYWLTVQGLKFIPGSRYIYIMEPDGSPDGNWTYQDFIQYNPVTMSGINLPTSVIVKYENYTKPPPTNQISMYGQTDLNEFTFRQGRTTESFTLEFVNPVRELWVVVQDPGVVNRIVLRLNNEIIIDDDQVTTRYIRTFESHTTMPTSSNVNVYSFSLTPEKLHPSGTLNMSRIAYPVLDITLASEASADLYLRVYSKSFNVLGYQGGIGGLLFNSAL